MVLSQLFRSPFVRFPFLGFAVVATVATSQAEGWSLQDTTPREHVELAPAASIERSIAYEASEANVQLVVDLGGVTTDRGKVRLVAEACEIDVTFEQREPKRWYREESGYSDAWLVTPRASGYCRSKEGTAKVRVENVGTLPIAANLTIEAEINGPGGVSDPPKDAFVRIRQVP